MRAVVVFLLLCSPAVAQHRAFVEGPQTVKPGGKLVLRASTSLPSLIWWIFPDEIEYELSDNNKLCYVWPGCKAGATFSVSLFGVPIDGDKIVGDPFQERHVITVEGVVPPPDPDSDGDGVRDSLDKCPNTSSGTRVDVNGCPLVNPPPPPDDPVFPHGTYGFSKLAYDLAKQVPSVARVKGKALGANFDAVAAAMAAGVYPTLSAALEDSTNRNRTTLGTDRDAWLPWFTSFQTELGKIYDAGGRMAEFAEAYREISTGLKAVPGS